MIVPVLSGSGMRIKIVEGLCYGKAIVSTSLGAEGIDVTPGHHMLQFDSPESFSSAVIELLKDGEKRSNLEKNARSFALAQLNYLPIAEKLVAFYKKLIHS
jgi:glycosyltransferase involved in cell wall biosynthesis